MTMTSASDATAAAEEVRSPADPVYLVYLAGSGLELAAGTDDVQGLVVVDPDGRRLGEVGDLVIDTRDRRARLLAVESGGILGLATTRRLVPVELVAKIDERVHVGLSYAQVAADTGLVASVESDFADVYDRYGVAPSWQTGHRASYFHTPLSAGMRAPGTGRTHSMPATRSRCCSRSWAASSTTLCRHSAAR